MSNGITLQRLLLLLMLCPLGCSKTGPAETTQVETLEEIWAKRSKARKTRAVFKKKLAPSLHKTAYRLHGFSADGKQLAIESYGRLQNSAFRYAELSLFDIDTNSMHQPPISASGKNLATTRSRAKTETRPHTRQSQSAWHKRRMALLKRFKIVSKARQQLPMQPMKEKGAGSLVFVGKTPVSITSKRIEDPREKCARRLGAGGIEVTLSRPGKPSIVLNNKQWFRHLGCLGQYKLQAAFYAGNTLALVFRYAALGKGQTANVYFGVLATRLY